MENGELPQTNGNDNSSGAESDALVIDEQASNPYFSESLFELSQQHQKKKKKKKYAQYLGLQPSVQFKCSRCSRAGFESLGALNDHLVECTETAPVQEQSQCSSTFKLTRKVFLCSACGTYYENWNLYLHMLEVHKRFLCLYCLGMFSVLDDLCAHIQSKHNFEPGYKNNPNEFFGVYNEPCYILCCECNKLFNEQDNFFYHTCTSKKTANKAKSKIKQIKPKEHVTAESTNNQSQQKDSDNEPDFKGFNSSEKSEFLEFCREFFNPQQNNKTDQNEDVPQQDDEDEEYDEEEEEEEEYDEDEDCDDNNSDTETIKKEDVPIETRKVPKLSLKLKPGSFPEIESVPSEDDSQLKDIEQEESEKSPHTVIDSNEPNPCNEENETETTSIEKEKNSQIDSELPLLNGDLERNDQQIQIADSDIPIIELNELEQPLDKYDIILLLKKCLNATSSMCIYCNHARKIAVNGKQLGLHAIAEHRYSAVVSSITAEELIPESFVVRIKDCLNELELIWFNLDNDDVNIRENFECFQCRFTTNIHKELYLHNRKLHAKNLLLCIMCKLNFYSYSELICHLCPGLYILDYDVKFRCCLCVNEELPSAFRLMVHLRKRHNICDVCLELCHNQYKLSNHVWKHKLHHFCYRCCIAYRNKPDITRHLFWKHGTESVLCKKCLQKKWPHVYHFCVPPLNFQCNECSLSFTKAVALKVHKRIHTNDKPHKCTFVDNDGNECNETFISKKLRLKHELKHQEPLPPPPQQQQQQQIEIVQEAVMETKNDSDIIKDEKCEEEKPKPKIDVYDLPELNLSESSDSEDDNKIDEKVIDKNVIINEIEDLIVNAKEEEEKVVLENVWDDFKNYQANKEKFDMLINDKTEDLEKIDNEDILTEEMALRDHDYCANPNNKDITFTEVKPDLTQSVDHDYCTTPKQDDKKIEEEDNNKQEIVKKRSNLSSSSDSDSSSCLCGSNCSCSSSSSSTSSTSDSSNSDSSTEEGRKRQQLRRDRRRQKKTNTNTKLQQQQQQQPEPQIDVVNKVEITEQQIQESDLETTESETDEEFYDKQPQKLAKKILEEKRNQLLAGIEFNGQLDSRPTTPQLPSNLDELKTSKKKSKSKKKKKKKKKLKKRKDELKQAPYYQYYQPPQPPIAPIILSRNSPKTPPIQETSSQNSNDDVNLRASKRRRVPNKFYGYSSEEDEPKWRKTEFIPPLTIKTTTPLLSSPHLPKIQPFSIRLPPPSPTTTTAMPLLPVPKRLPPIKLTGNGTGIESGGESNDSSTEGRVLGVDPDALYCYCKCPYDEVSEMIGCDSRDCTIEWFHFECVGIMVPPKGHWYCPECRKKRQQKRDLLKMKANLT